MGCRRGHRESKFARCSAKKTGYFAGSMQINAPGRFAVKRSSCLRENFVRTLTSALALSPMKCKNRLR